MNPVFRSPNYGQRLLPVSMVVLHYTGMPSAHEALERLCDPAAMVSCHYLLEEDGTLHRLVDEPYRAWHAGAGYWQGVSDVNSASIGIELVNPGHEWGYCPFPAAQMTALTHLLQDLLTRYSIHPARLVGHSDVAPVRKQDPGELFPWESLARQGFGLWPPAGLPEADPAAILPLLLRCGYDITTPEATLQAFHRRFYPARLNQPADGISAARAAWLATQSPSFPLL
jgi:N-acetylmuramoyl-L-alanine amidase